MSYWMRRLRAALPWILGGALSSSAVVLAMAPAAWITPQFARQSGGHVNLVDPAGSIWHGSATLMLAAGSDMSAATLLPGRIEWRTGFWPLFTGRLRMVMRHSEAMPDPITVDATLRSATVTPGTLAVPASLLSGLGAPFNTLDLQGDVQLSWSEWRSFNRQAFGQLTLTLNDVSSRISLVKPLGSYRVTLQAQGASSVLDLTTLKGPLMLSGSGTVSGASTSFRGTASATPEARENLAGLLNLLGRPSGLGTVALNFVR
jgi:general secretion pathway protein N